MIIVIINKIFISRKLRDNIKIKIPTYEQRFLSFQNTFWSGRKILELFKVSLKI